MDAERAKKEASTRSTIRPPRRRVDQVEREKQHSTHRQARRLFFPAFRAETLADARPDAFFSFSFCPADTIRSLSAERAWVCFQADVV